jgi:hypothetical protein
MLREERLLLREELRVKMETYDTIIRRLQFEKMNLWQQQILNDRELRRMEVEGEQYGKPDNQPDSGT